MQIPRENVQIDINSSARSKPQIEKGAVKMVVEPSFGSVFQITEYQ